MISIRHGDMALIPVDKLPDGLKKADTNVLMTGSHGKDHLFTRGIFYPSIKDFVVGYFDAPKGTELHHPDHGAIVEDSENRVTEIPPGTYEVRKQQEDTHEGMRPVID